MQMLSQGKGRHRAVTGAWLGVTAGAALLLTACAGPTAPPPESGSGAPAVEADTEAVDPGLEATLEVLNCLEGKWEIDKTSDLWDLPYGDADETRGTIAIYFDPVSSWMLEYDDVYAYTEIADLTEHEVTVTANGTSIGSYDVDADGIVTTTVTDPGIEFTGENANIFHVDADDGVIGEFVELVYRCDGETLTGYSALTGDLDEPVAVYRLVERIMAE